MEEVIYWGNLWPLVRDGLLSRLVCSYGSVTSWIPGRKSYVNVVFVLMTGRAFAARGLALFWCLMTCLGVLAHKDGNAFSQ